VTIERSVRALEPKVRSAVAEATRIARAARAGVKAGAAAYRAGRPPKR
jgi:thiazole synthase ThiGH ThiG subunit